MRSASKLAPPDAAPLRRLTKTLYVAQEFAVIFEVLVERDEQTFDALISGVRSHNFENAGTETSKPLSVVCRDQCGSLIGGIAGSTIYKQFLIDVLWVEKNSRRTGLGRKLMEMAEIEAKKRGCLAAQVDTLAFQGPEFYE